MNEVAICKIMSYIENALFEPRYRWSESMFKERSYSRWAAFEILERIMDRPFTQPDLIIEEFIIKMAYFSCINEDTEASRMFIVARDAAEDILSLF